MKNSRFSLSKLAPFIPVIFGTVFVLMLPHNTSKPLLFTLSVIIPILWGLCGYFIGKEKTKPFRAIFWSNFITIVGVSATLILELVRYFIGKEVSLLDDIYYYVGFFTSHFAAAFAHLSISFTGIGYNVMYLGVVFLFFTFVLGYFTGFAQRLSEKENELADKIYEQGK